MITQHDIDRATGKYLPKCSVKIDEIPDNPGTWRAVISLPWILANLPGINGGGTEEGPWVAGTGGSAEMALTHAYEHIGRAIMRMPIGERDASV